ncbi:WD repeat and SOCS box-containing protein 1-like isoform X1 [Dreissena polymorpha]|uniref:SOCS box domain-containing protein n=1 Tax=Dreissena polymorpha TaxID=45954 RepID=A0A9D4MJ24_DREPO|nr:WD repeat and SOCS box-containing protein 1-like isoform X1 [Dreissena polymorpha]XP_052270567.1 WD repeat and SOCS box-containing protein 1-like isoform X1 [Dreissena polymorpha]XP_052270577.1 WD repeat and SOCS box-containing protein 1-like isoform X2 [Dreissena polymorpha]XP_052270585.1 WD repeat and SOCS box-containing protein 1-like isoform X1 [Dreissena polymorpha]XP_052270592.1 WD repeat and SOCS box-containing protein 1-like isoform X1 [Dreissena polymorpha]XP_052270603.1 WD repeat 
MTQDETPRSFCKAEATDLGSGIKTEVQSAIFKSHYCENWSVAWAPDCSYVAWSQGGGIIYLLPWERQEGKLVNKPVRNRSYDNLSEVSTEQPFISDSLPRLSPRSDIVNKEDDTDADVSDTEVIDSDEIKVESSSASDSKSVIKQGEENRQCFRIDCMDVVWCMAFGSSMSEMNHIWMRFNARRDLILATGLRCGKIKLWNVHSGTMLLELSDHKSIVRDLSFTSDGSFHLVSCSNDCTVKFWDLNDDGNMYKTVRFAENTMVWSCCWSPNGEQVAAVGQQKKVYIWNTKNFQLEPKKLVGHHHHVCKCAYSPDGALLATASFDTRVFIWDPYTGDSILALGHLFPPPRPIFAGGANDHFVRDLSFSREGQFLATVADDGYLRVWDINGDCTNPKWVAETPKPLSCAYSTNGHVIAVGSGTDGIIEFFQPEQIEVSPLQHLCRAIIRKNLPSQSVDFLPMPSKLKEFLKYKHL